MRLILACWTLPSGWLLGRAMLYGLLEANVAWGTGKYMRPMAPLFILILVLGTALTGAVSAYAQYDVAGNVVKAIDANNNATTIDFADRFGSPNGDAQSNVPAGEAPYVTAPSVWLAGQTTFAFPTKVTNAINQSGYTQYDYFLGKPVDAEDPNTIK